MVRKISAIIITVAIVVTGVTAFVKLNYWERSVKIFRLNSDQLFSRDMGGGHRGFEERERQEKPDGFERDFDFRVRQHLPDSLSGAPVDGRDFRALPDSIQQNGRSGEFFGDRGSFNGNFRHGRRSGDFHGESRIRLGNAGQFLYVFAFFSLITIGIDKGLHRLRRRKK